eukprot:6134101-Amphidinium_carterae.1
MTWLWSTLEVLRDDLHILDSRRVAHYLRLYGQHLYDIGRPLGEYSEVINAVVDWRPDLRGQLREAWQVAWDWKTLVPARSHMPLPVPVLQAFLTVAALLHQVDLFVALVIGFSACLRPAELAGLRVDDVLLPSDRM